MSELMPGAPADRPASRLHRAVVVAALLLACAVGFSAWAGAPPSSAAPVQVNDDDGDRPAGEGGAGSEGPGEADPLDVGGEGDEVEDRDVVVRADDPELVAAGRELFEVGCSSCHGLDGAGLSAPDGDVRGPSLLESGEASAYYYMTTGRMPLANSEEIPERKDRAYDDEEIDALVAFVGSLGDAEAPALPDVDIAEADLPVGGDLYREHCQACHQASGSGGALSYGRAAPSLEPSTPSQVGAAMRSGPGQMPVFGPDLLTQDEVDDIARYVRYLSDPADPGGLPIARTGPVPEGFVSWILGVGALLVLSAWIGTRSPIARRRAHP